MKSKLVKHIRVIGRSISIQTQCFLLLLKNLLFIRMLKVKSVTLLECIIIEGNEATLFWKVRGCHRIKIDGIGTTKGNSNGVKFKVHDINKSIRVCFYGIARRKYKSITFNGSKVYLQNKFYSNSDLPIKVEAPHNRNTLESQFSISKVETNFQKVFFEFDHFDQNEYEPLNTIQ